MKKLIFIAALTVVVSAFGRPLEQFLIMPGMTREEAASRFDKSFPSSDEVMQGSVRVFEQDGVVAVFLSDELVRRILYQWDSERTRESLFEIFLLWRNHFDARIGDTSTRLRLNGVWLVGGQGSMDPPDEDILAISYYDNGALIVELTLAGEDLRNAKSSSRWLKVDVFGKARG